MTANPAPTQRRGPPTPAEINARQKADAERVRQRKADAARAALERANAPAGTAVVPAAKPALPATMPPDNRTPVQRYLDAVAPATMVGRQIKTSKEHVFATSDDGEPAADVDYTALCDQAAVGLIRFNGEGNPPDYRMGLLYDGFVMPDRETLGDTDPAAWELGLDGKPADPWRHFMYLPLQRGDTGELFTYTTSSVTGRRAVGNLLRHYDRMQRTHPDTYPVVRLKVGGFSHRDERVGWVQVPVFAVVGRQPKDTAAKPDSSPAADYQDSIPF
jgi:hypothetical protein